MDYDTLLRAAAPLIELAVAEDIGPGDATSQALLDAECTVHGRMIAKAPGVIAGLPVAEAVFQRVDARIVFTARVAEGQEVTAGEVIAEVSGPAPAVLAAERTALNFLQRMSGIATLTRRYVDAVACTRAVILDTRKTVPGHRALDKYAVRMGGGVNHRQGLYDMLLIKDNHVDAVGGILPAVERARAARPDLPIEVEVRNLDELRQALSITPSLDRIMLDNMSLEDMRQAVVLTAGRVPLEASGGVSLETVAAIAATGVDSISVGALTHSAPALDISLDWVAPTATQDTADLDARIRRVKATLGDRLVILGHHYQRDEVLAHADIIGDSLELARGAARIDAEFIVFCGVHFMAETAAILARPGQVVVMPDPDAGCYLADTATPEAVQAAWDYLTAVFKDIEAEVTPITYVNSAAALKAFCGRHGGAVCTSSNAEAVLRAALQQRPRVFFFPDQHLGRNTARRMGIRLDEMVLWNVRQPPPAEAIRQARVILWPGACHVHQRFLPQHVHAARERAACVRVIVHPECPMQVVDLADDSGSTGYIIRAVQAALPGTRWAIGTETRLVERLQRQFPDQEIRSLAEAPPFCRYMGQTTLGNLADVLEKLARGQIENRVTVDATTAQLARLALERMLAS